MEIRTLRNFAAVVRAGNVTRAAAAAGLTGTLAIGAGETLALRGHLLLPFVATAVFRLQQERLEGSPYNPQSLFQNLRNQKCKVHDTQVIPQEPAKKANDACRLLGIHSPAELPRPDRPLA